MAYYDDIKNYIDIKKDSIIEGGINYIIGKGAIIEGYKKIISYSSSNIYILMSNSKIDINGEKLVLKKINKDELVINGKIVKMEIME